MAGRSVWCCGNHKVFLFLLYGSREQKQIRCKRLHNIINYPTICLSAMFFLLQLVAWFFQLTKTNKSENIYLDKFVYWRGNHYKYCKFFVIIIIDCFCNLLWNCVTKFFLGLKENANICCIISWMKLIFNSKIFYGHL